MKIIQAPSPNFSASPWLKTVIVLHVTLGSYGSALNWLRNPKSKASAHYIIGRKAGEVAQLIQIDKDAWHAGRVRKPSELAKAVMPKNSFGRWVNPNKYTIGIEVAGGYGNVGVEYNKWQVSTVAKLCRQLNITEPSHIITHRDIASYKPNIDASRERVLNMLAPPVNEQPDVGVEVLTLLNKAIKLLTK